MSLSAVGSSGVTLSNASSTTPTIASSNRAASFAMTAARLGADAGVIASFSGSSAAIDSTAQLYNSLANAGQNSVSTTTSAISAALGLAPAASTDGTPTASSGDTSAATSTTGTSASTSTSSSPTPGSGAAWASILKANPMMAPMAAQLTQRQQIVDMLA